MKACILAHVDTRSRPCSHSAEVTGEIDMVTLPRAVISHGSRACERALLDDLLRLLDQAGPRVLEQPILVLVPSHSLRSHLLQKLVQARGRSIAGLGCWTLHGFALEVLERLGSPAPSAGALFPVLARRLARQEKPLRECLDHLQDGYASVVGSVSDLLEAGLDVAHEEALVEALLEEGPAVAGRSEIDRARSLVRVAVGVRETMQDLGTGHVSDLFQQATARLKAAPSPPFPASALRVHGFADATGLATDFLEVVLQRFGGTLYLDHPPDPADPQRADPGILFTRRFSERLLAACAGGEAPPEPLVAPEVDLFQALGTEAEVREVARRVRQLLDSGTAPESIGIVARQLEGYRSALRTHLWRLAIPFSSVGTRGPQHPAGRRIRALLYLLAQGDAARVDRWLDARVDDFGDVASFDLRLALAGLGAGRLREVAELDLDRLLTGESHPLPVRHGYRSDDDGDGAVRLSRRRIPSDALHDVREEARRICRLFEHWKAHRDWKDHQQGIAEILDLLQWRSGREPHDEVRAALDRLITELPETLRLEFDELVLLLTDTLGGLGSGDFGGRGAGVQILDVIEARGRTFDHLFLLGLNKGVFPRSVREDPLLPDSLRQVLGHEGHGVLPDLPRKLLGHAEERFLFAQLLSSSPRITVSWLAVDDDHHQLTTSPLVERLLWSETMASDGPRREAPLLGSRLPRVDIQRDQSVLQTPYEHAVLTALRGSRRQLKASLQLAATENSSTAASWLGGTPEAPASIANSDSSLAPARLRILDELDRGPSQSGRLGPYFGFLGAAIDPVDPRLAQPLYVTTLERFAECPWRTFLERVLRLEALPDPVDVLPGLDPLLIGQLVHRVLERLVARQRKDTPNSLAEALEREPSNISWPSTRPLSRIVLREAQALAREHGFGWDGFAAILAQVVLPYLELARELTWQGHQGARPLAVELDCAFEVGTSSGIQTLHCRVDRLDADETGLLLSDYKTGKTGVSEANRVSTRSQHLLKKIRSGRLLQAVAYSQATGRPEDRGRYVYIRPDFKGPDESRVVIVEAGDSEAREAFESAVRTLISAWKEGTFFPRLVEVDDDKEPRPCGYCAVAEACLRGDSSARGRLRDWMNSHRNTGADRGTLIEAWLLASTKEAKS